MRVILAVHVEQGVRYLLVDWEGHKVPTWIPDTGTLQHTYSTEGLTDREDDDEVFRREVGPEAYTLYAGELRHIICCDPCENDPDHKDEWDLRLYVDASTHGNVRDSLCAPGFHTLTAIAVV